MPSTIYDGFSTIIGASDLGGIPFKEKKIQPPDLDGGGALDATDMRNNYVRTKLPKTLLTVGDVKGTVYYNPEMYTQIFGAFQYNQKWSIIFPDASKLDFRGWLEKFTPVEHAEGENPLAEIIIMVSNVDITGFTYTAMRAGAVGGIIIPSYAAGPFNYALFNH